MIKKRDNINFLELGERPLYSIIIENKCIKEFL